jgi:hypothetical protein
MFGCFCSYHFLQVYEKQVKNKKGVYTYEVRS